MFDHESRLNNEITFLESHSLAQVDMDESSNGYL